MEYTLADLKQCVYALYRHTYAAVQLKSLGIDDSAITPPRNFRVLKPVVFSGSSITQGACASRPGLAYP